MKFVTRISLTVLLTCVFCLLFGIRFQWMKTGTTTNAINNGTNDSSGNGSSSSNHDSSNEKGSQNKQPLQTDIPTKKIGVDIYGRDVLMPLVGAGTWQYNDTIAYQSVCKAFQAGYSMVDTAFGYRNQRGVGRAIRDCWKGTRQELFVMTKIPGGLTRPEVWDAHMQNLRDLDLQYVDHLMTHFPADWQQSPDRSTPERRQEEWRALQEIYDTNSARSIGVSHYCPQHLEDVLAVSNTVKPSINQVEYHIGSGDIDSVIDMCRRHNITFMSFSPLCGPCHYQPKDSLISGDLVSGIASKHNVTGSQVSLRFIVQQALQDESAMGGVIPKSNSVSHIESNRQLFHFTLTDDEMAQLQGARQPPAESGDCSVQ